MPRTDSAVGVDAMRLSAAMVFVAPDHRRDGLVRRRRLVLGAFILLEFARRATQEKLCQRDAEKTVAWVTPSRIRFADYGLGRPLFVCANFDWKANNNEPS